MECIKCHTEQNEENFSWANKKLGKRHVYCRKCHGIYAKRQYQIKRVEYTAVSKIYQKSRRETNRSKVFEYLKTHPCQNCGVTDIRVLEFDHIDASKKRLEISKMLIRGWAWKKIETEIQKCAVLCANCHRIKTCSDRNWARGTA